MVFKAHFLQLSKGFRKANEERSSFLIFHFLLMVGFFESPKRGYKNGSGKPKNPSFNSGEK